MNLNINNNSLTISEFDSTVIINTRMKINWKEIIIYSIPAFIFMLKTHIVASLIIGFLTFIVYSIFRLSAWYFYSEIEINFNLATLIRRKFRNGDIVDKEIITTNLKLENFLFKENNRSGKLKYSMIYKTYKENDLVIINNVNDFLKLKTIFENHK